MTIPSCEKIDSCVDYYPIPFQRNVVTNVTVSSVQMVTVWTVFITAMDTTTAVIHLTNTTVLVCNIWYLFTFFCTNFNARILLILNEDYRFVPTRLFRRWRMSSANYDVFIWNVTYSSVLGINRPTLFGVIPIVDVFSSIKGPYLCPDMCLTAAADLVSGISQTHEQR
jgi:hypothetical protein